MEDYNSLAVKTLSQSIKRAVDKIISTAPFDVTMQGIVKGITQEEVEGVTRNKTGYYDIEINGNIYSIKSDLHLKTNDFVNVVFPQNNASNMFVYVYKPSECLDEYEHTQSTAATTWYIQHNLNRYPNIIIMNQSKAKVSPHSLVYTDKNNVVITFTSATAGLAIFR